MNALEELITHWKQDPNGTYRTWFLWEERIKNFRSIRRGLCTVIEEIETNRFGNAYRGSSLETIMGSIAEQKQLFKGADHPFVWKPKLRIPDIYENRENQVAFARFLKTCISCAKCDGIMDAIRTLDQQKIKGLGPAAANLLYFLLPTDMPPFNTAIVRGYNALTGAKVKLGKWNEYLAMRAGIMRLNDAHRELLSNDLGAISGFIFDVGSGRHIVPGHEANEEQLEQWKNDLRRIEEETVKKRKTERASNDSDLSHTEIQGWLRDIGVGLGFEVWIASNDKSRVFGTGRLGDGCLTELPNEVGSGSASELIAFIDVLWFKNGAVVAAFEVEHTTSIYSGILRLCDLALSEAGRAIKGLYLVAPDNREGDVRQQLARPAFQNIASLSVVKYLPYGEFEKHRDTISRFGEGLKAIDAIARRL